jgi:RNA polymerase subunit RPABC4/transcription elongation factor Spt4
MTNKKVEFEAYKLEEYLEIKDVEFPKEIFVAFAVCGKSCGNMEFITDGQTQVCQYCGKLMFRTDVKKYVLFQEENENVSKYNK